ncbi:Coatomer beta subunit appendage platform [Carpediemonas membranifera]|uniref:Coatomer beta subunit appendage platform n=1 Tax=Carpediemonas membranifera TaxID=201153 RepID=A0A8J6BDB5_9EUKA|nr:Coatomer beta subunit appendage platform [Carpediemonas membranifera]|eukprot:KAG9395112.1 Coatomer beta subunit appendage platform [Carpediemonas membranifera]
MTISIDTTHIASDSLQNLKPIFDKHNPDDMKVALRKIQAMLLENHEIPDEYMLSVAVNVYATNDKNLKLMMSILYPFLNWEYADYLLIVSKIQADIGSKNEFFAAATLRSIAHIPARDVLEHLYGDVKRSLRYEERPEAHVRESAIIAMHSIYRRFPNDETLISREEAAACMDGILKNDSAVPVVHRALHFVNECLPELALAVVTSKEYAHLWAHGDDSIQMARLKLLRTAFNHEQTTAEQREHTVLPVLRAIASDKKPSIFMLFEIAQVICDLCQTTGWLRQAANALLQVLTHRGASDLIRVTALSRIEALLQSGYSVGLSVREFMPLFAQGVVSQRVRERLFVLVFAIVDEGTAGETLVALRTEVDAVLSDKPGEDGERYISTLLDTFIAAATRTPLLRAHPTSIDLLMHLSTGSRMKAVAVHAVETLRTYVPMLTRPAQADLVPRLFGILGKVTVPRVLRVLAYLIVSCTDQPQNTLRQMVDVFTATDDAADQPNTVTVVDPATGQYVTRQRTTAAPSAIRTIITSKKNAFICISVSICMAKLYLLAVRDLTPADAEGLRVLRVRVVKLMAGMIKDTAANSEDTRRQMMIALSAVLRPNEAQSRVLLDSTAESFTEFIAASGNDAAAEVEHVPAHAAPAFRLLNGGGVVIPPDVTDDGLDMDLNKLLTVRQLTGQSERIYTEVFVTVRGYTVILEVVLLNRSSETVQDVTLELTPTNGIRCADRIISATLGPHEATMIRRSLRATATEAGVVFGAISYTSRKPVVNTTTCIQLDVSSFLTPTDVDSSAFKSMWQSFEWENRINICMVAPTAADVIKRIAKETNTRVLNRSSLYSDAIGCANLYAVSVFNEQALLNVSCQRNDVTNKMEGVVRVRTKVQGLAVCLGEKIGRIAV